MNQEAGNPGHCDLGHSSGLGRSSGRHRIVFLAVPESLRGQIDHPFRSQGDGCDDDDTASFSIDPDIPIPVEIPEGEEKLNLEELSWEMILSGMLHVISSGEGEPARINYYRRFVLALRPGILGEFTEAAVLKARNGDFDLALEIFDALRGLFPGSPVPLLNRALALEERAALYEKQGREEAEAEYQAAAEAYEEATSLRPPFPDAYFNAGFFYLGQKDYSRAREYLCGYLDWAEDATSTDRSEAEGGSPLGEKKEQTERALREIGESGLEDDSFREAYNLIQQGKEEQALISIRDFLERRPAVWNGWFMLGWALRRLGRWEDGAAAFGKAVELGGGGSDTRNELAICLMKNGDTSGARRELETALRDDPENVKIISNLGVLALKNGDDDEAAAFFRTVLEFDPADPVARNFMEERGLGAL